MVEKYKLKNSIKMPMPNKMSTSAYCLEIALYKIHTAQNENNKCFICKNENCKKKQKRKRNCKNDSHLKIEKTPKAVKTN